MSSLWTPDGERPVGRPAPDPAGGSTGGPSGRSAGGPSRPAGGSDATGRPGGAGRSPGADQPDIDDRHRSPAGVGPSRPDGPSDAAQAELARLRQELVQTPAAVVVANHAYGLFELAAIHLSEQPPNLAEAQLAVDAFGAVVEALGERLAEAAGPLRDALAQIRLAFVQLSATGPAGG